MKQQQPSQEEEDMEEDNRMKEVEKENQEEDNLEEEKEAIVVSLLWPHILQKPLMKKQQKSPQQTMQLLNLQSPLGKKRPQKQIYPQLFIDN